MKVMLLHLFEGSVQEIFKFCLWGMLLSLLPAYREYLAFGFLVRYEKCLISVIISCFNGCLNCDGFSLVPSQIYFL